MSIKRIDIIRQKAAEKNLSLAEVFREAKLPYSTVQNWDNKEPEAFTTFDTLVETIEKMPKKEAEEASS